MDGLVYQRSFSSRWTLQIFMISRINCEISDATGSHKTELEGIKKLKEMKEEELNTQAKDILLTKKKPIEVNRQQYVKQLKQYENDPIQGMREIMNQPNSKIKSLTITQHLSVAWESLIAHVRHNMPAPQREIIGVLVK